ncbi:MAG: c-type cytochrome biogenesis protein CcmI [Pseudomonadota bacterium]
MSTLWIVFALLTFFAVALVLAPLRSKIATDSRTDTDDANEASDLSVYRAQLGEIDQDRDRGLISESDAESARIEVSRRLLARARVLGIEVDDASQSKAPEAPANTASPPRTGRRFAAATVIVAIPALALSLYMVIGSPNLPGQPLAERLAEATGDQNLDILIARVETHLAANPEDGQGWEVLAPVYRRLGRVEDAARAYRNVIRLLGSNAERQADLGEMLVAARDGVVEDDARSAFEAALAHDPEVIKARYYLGVAAEQDGNSDEALGIWQALVEADGEPDAIWRQVARERLVALGGTVPEEPQVAPNSPPSGPTEEDIAAAQELSPEDRMAMIRSMVEGLDVRLDEDGSDLDGWLRLMRAYTVLGENDQAIRAVSRAREALAGNEAALQQIDEAARSLQILN